MGAKMTPSEPKLALIPVELIWALKWPQDGSRSAQAGFKMDEVGPKTASNELKLPLGEL